MYDEDKHPKNYSQLAAIQLGWLMKNGAVTWKADETAANGKDKGCFSHRSRQVPRGREALMTEVAQIKGKGDKARAEKLVKDFVDVTGDKKKVHDVITERVLRSPKPSFVYSIKVDWMPSHGGGERSSTTRRTRSFGGPRARRPRAPSSRPAAARSPRAARRRSSPACRRPRGRDRPLCTPGALGGAARPERRPPPTVGRECAGSFFLSKRQPMRRSGTGRSHAPSSQSVLFATSKMTASQRASTSLPGEAGEDAGRRRIGDVREVAVERDGPERPARQPVERRRRLRGPGSESPLQRRRRVDRPGARAPTPISCTDRARRRCPCRPRTARPRPRRCRRRRSCPSGCGAERSASRRPSRTSRRCCAPAPLRLACSLHV